MLEMVCELCFPNAVEICRIGSAVWLFKENDSYSLIGSPGHKGYEFLTFSTKPIPDTDPECNDKNDTWIDNLDDIDDKLIMPVGRGYDLMTSCIEAGFGTRSQSECGFSGRRFSGWLFHYCGQMIKKHEEDNHGS